MRSKKIGQKGRRIISNTIIYIILVLISIIWVFPFFYLIIQSLRIDNPGLSLNLFPDNWQYGLDNYIKLFTDSAYNFGRWYLNTLIIAVLTTIFQTILVLMTAYALSRLRFKGRKGLMKFMLIIGMFPGFLGMICIYKILQAVGLQTSIFGLFLVYIAGSAMNYYISKGFFDTIPRSLDEAALIDGANRNTVFWRIIIPLSKPIVVYTVLTAFLAGSQEAFTVAVGLQQWIQPTLSGMYFTRFCAGGVFVSIPIVILFFWLQRYYVEGVTGGAVKG